MQQGDKRQPQDMPVGKSGLSRALVKNVLGLSCLTCLNSLFLVASLLLVVRPGAPSSFLFLVAMPGASSSAPAPVSFCPHSALCGNVRLFSRRSVFISPVSAVSTPIVFNVWLSTHSSQSTVTKCVNLWLNRNLCVYLGCS